ncbi:MAG: hypothetical protein LLF97_11870 [Planctomycetaceae bacterium]|nr:hypothetical protein [Planctomycetaceae bacterium]
MSPQKSTNLQEPSLSAPAAPRRAPAKPDLYTVLLVIALVAVLIGIVFLYLEMASYDFEFQGGPRVGMLLERCRMIPTHWLA